MNMMMRIISYSSSSSTAYKQLGLMNMAVVDPFIPWRRNKDKVVIVIGATGTGKSRLSIDLATRFPAEIVNSDKMQVYKGLDITTNKVTVEECRGIPHHLLGIIDPNDCNDKCNDFTAADFQDHATNVLESITRRGLIPIIAGGSNSFIKALVNDNLEFRSKYECCFLWIDVAMPVLHSFVSERVDRMVKEGLVEEVREFFNPEGEYNLGIRRAIGIPEMDHYFRNEDKVDGKTKEKILQIAIEKIKTNTCKLACCQVQNILRLREQLGWNMHYVDATEVFLKRGGGDGDGEESDEAWERLVVGPCSMIVSRFLEEFDHEEEDNFVNAISSTTATAAAAAIAAASH